MTNLFWGLLSGFTTIISMAPLIGAAVLIGSGILGRVPWLLVSLGVLGCGLAGGYLSGYNTGTETEKAAWVLERQKLRDANTALSHKINAATRTAAREKLQLLEDLRGVNEAGKAEMRQAILAEIEMENQQQEPVVLKCPESSDVPETIECPKCPVCRSLTRKPPDRLLRAIEKIGRSPAAGVRAD